MKYATKTVDHAALKGAEGLNREVSDLTGKMVGKADLARGSGPIKEFDEATAAEQGTMSITKEEMFSPDGLKAGEKPRPNYADQLKAANMSMNTVIENGKEVTLVKLNMGVSLENPTLMGKLVDCSSASENKLRILLELGDAPPVGGANLAGHPLGDVMVRALKQTATDTENELAAMGIKDVKIFTPDEPNRFMIQIGPEGAEQIAKLIPGKGTASEKVANMLAKNMEKMTNGLEFKPVADVVENAQGKTIDEVYAELKNMSHAKRLDSVGFGHLSDEEMTEFMNKTTKYGQLLSNPGTAVPAQTAADFEKLGIPLVKRGDELFVDTAKFPKAIHYGARDPASALATIKEYCPPGTNPEEIYTKLVSQAGKVAVGAM